MDTSTNVAEVSPLSALWISLAISSRGVSRMAVSNIKYVSVELWTCKLNVEYMTDLSISTCIDAFVRKSRNERHTHAR